jgi:hypothetical protein
MNHLNFTEKRYSGATAYDIVNLVEDGWVPVSKHGDLSNCASIILCSLGGQLVSEPEHLHDDH